MNILQKEDLSAASFANDNTNAAGGLTIRTDAGSTVGDAIGAAITGAAGGDLLGTYPNPTLNPVAVVAAVVAQPTGAPAVAGDLVLGDDGEFHALPSVPFATPAETIAGLVTGKAVDPADLTAKLANQPPAGACTDREDVVWDGTILQGAAKHYSFSGSFPSIYFPALAGTTVVAGILGTQSVTITNPSSCRTLRVVFDSSAGASGSNVSSASGQNIYSYVYVGATAYLINLGQENYITNGRFSSIGSGIISASYFDLAPGASQVISLYLEMIGAPLLFNDAGAIRAFATYTAQTI